MYKLVFFVPTGDAERVKDAIFETGAGGIGAYDHCSFETEGTGQFRPLAGSNPHLGSTGSVERVRELRVEILCTGEQIRPALEALRRAHPYEVPAYEVYPLAKGFM